MIEGNLFITGILSLIFMIICGGLGAIYKYHYPEYYFDDPLVTNDHGYDSDRDLKSGAGWGVFISVMILITFFIINSMEKIQ